MMNQHTATRSDAIATLRRRFGDALVTSAPIRAQHANTTTWIPAEPPDAVLFPQSTAEVQEAGILTELTLRLHALPEATGVVTCRFPTLGAACDTAIGTMEAGLAPSRIELLDSIQIRVVNAATGFGLPESSMLFVEFGGSPDAVAVDMAAFRGIAEAGGAEDLQSSLRPEERSRLWKTRHDVFWASKSYRPGAEVVVSDVCVPISRLSECIEAARADIERSQLVAPIVGHVGDGNFHALVLVRMEDAAEVARAKGFLDRLARLAIEVGGTCTGEHGIGQGKRELLEAELGSETVAVMRTLKVSLDPNNILNPGKIF